MEKKKAKLEKKSNFGKKLKKWKKKEGKLEKKWKNTKTKRERGKSTVDYCCNPQWFRCRGTVITPHHLDIVNIYIFILFFFFLISAFYA